MEPPMHNIQHHNGFGQGQHLWLQDIQYGYDGIKLQTNTNMKILH